mmetsp:Transcript_13659/g.18095  ORF Transcript_13659/g.18095 Transcript_13659/m.18095 type:complete len:258 (+) Transcript_13659:541-1314(+)
MYEWPVPLQPTDSGAICVQEGRSRRTAWIPGGANARCEQSKPNAQAPYNVCCCANWSSRNAPTPTSWHAPSTTPRAWYPSTSAIWNGYAPSSTSPTNGHAPSAATTNGYDAPPSPTNGYDGANAPSGYAATTTRYATTTTRYATNASSSGYATGHATTTAGHATYVHGWNAPWWWTGSANAFPGTSWIPRRTSSTTATATKQPRELAKKPRSNGGESAQMESSPKQALRRQKEIWICRHLQRGHATRARPENHQRSR